mgnify:CR=1 FL=1
MRTTLTLILALISSSHLWAGDKIKSKIDEAIYGDDNRIFVEESGYSRAELFARSTAAKIPTSALKKEFGGLLYSVTGKSLQLNNRVCEDENLAKETVLSTCSAFLVAPDLLLTAGHCIRSEVDCANSSWVFDFKKSLIPGDGVKAYFSPDEVYSCASIVHREYKPSAADGKLDYALIRLNKEVFDRSPLPYRMHGKIEDKASLMMIGYPSGMAATITTDAYIRTNDKEHYFTTNLDSFAGNSGSPVFNESTGIVEGFLVRGEKDFIWDENNQCNRLVKCTMNNCKGEDVIRITSVSELMNFKFNSLGF